MSIAILEIDGVMRLERCSALKVIIKIVHKMDNITIYDEKIGISVDILSALGSLLRYYRK